MWGLVSKTIGFCLEPFDAQSRIAFLLIAVGSVMIRFLPLHTAQMMSI